MLALSSVYGLRTGPHSTSPKAALNPLNLKSYNKLGVSLQGDSGGEMPQQGRGIVSRGVQCKAGIEVNQAVVQERAAYTF
jgi:hypothetical protein